MVANPPEANGRGSGKIFGHCTMQEWMDDLTVILFALETLGQIGSRSRMAWGGEFDAAFTKLL